MLTSDSPTLVPSAGPGLLARPGLTHAILRPAAVAWARDDAR
jgi:hypothetical protein